MTKETTLRNLRDAEAANRFDLDSLARAFKADGAVVVRGLFTPEEVALAERGVEANLAKPGPYAAVASDPSDPGRFFEDFRNWQRIPEYGALASRSAAPAVAGALIGARFAGKVNPETLRKGFGWLVLMMASVIMGEEIHPAVGLTVAAVTVIAGAMTFACNHYAACPLRRLMHRSAATGATA